MAYLLDSNTYIDAYLRYYSMDLCPGFWEWLDQAHKNQTVLTLDKIKEELLRKDDEIATWVKDAPASYFVPLDADCMESLGEVSRWVTDQDYKQAAVSSFFSQSGLLPHRIRESARPHPCDLGTTHFRENQSEDSHRL